MNHVAKKQVLVIGAGLAGLISALRLQKAGYEVALVEKRAKVGGLCGTFQIDGHEFVIACNDFGSGLRKLLKELDVDIKFENKKSKVFYRGNWFNAAPGLGMLWQLRSEWKNVTALIGGIIAQQFPWRTSTSIEDFANSYTTPGAVNDLAKLIAYFMGVSPTDIQTAYFGLDGKFNYGYTKMTCPVGGPQALADAIAKAFVEHGGEVFLDNTYQGYSKKDNCFYTELLYQEKSKIIESNYILDTREQASLYAPDTKRGLPLSMLCLAINRAFVYPRHTHTITYFEPGVSDWFGKLDRGEQPLRFGFHVFKSDIKNPTAYAYPLNIYFYLPRGITQLETNQRETYRDYIFMCLGNL